MSDVPAIEVVLYEHRLYGLTCYDHPPTPERPVWCCVCGEHELAVSWRRHVAEHLSRAFPPEATALDGGAA